MFHDLFCFCLGTISNCLHNLCLYLGEFVCSLRLVASLSSRDTTLPFSSSDESSSLLISLNRISVHIRTGPKGLSSPNADPADGVKKYGIYVQEDVLLILPPVVFLKNTRYVSTNLSQICPMGDLVNCNFWHVGVPFLLMLLMFKPNVL